MVAVTAWLVMGGYGWFVWPSYAICLLILVLNVYLPLRHHKYLIAGITDNQNKKL